MSHEILFRKVRIVIPINVTLPSKVVPPFTRRTNIVIQDSVIDNVVDVDVTNDNIVLRRSQRICRPAISDDYIIYL